MEGFALAGSVWIGLALYNLLVLALYALDKGRARRGRRRISEAALLWLAALGGGAGALLGVYLVRHKSRKGRFALGVPLLLAAQLAALWLWWQRR
ncbi:MAG: DUF1294 domain-containing protein [Bacillota bacterium]